MSSSNTDDLPRIHHREKLVREAESRLRGAIVDAGIHKLDLSEAEYLQVVSTVLHEQLSTTLKYAIRRERHGDTDKPGGLEG